MRKIFTFVALIFVFLAVSPISAYAEDYYGQVYEISDELDSLLDEYDLGFSTGDISELSFSELAVDIKNSLVSRINAPSRILCAVFLVIIFSTIMKSAGSTTLSKSSADIYNMVCVMTAVTVIVPQLLTIYNETLSTLQYSGNFILVFVPVFASVSAVSGGLASAGVYHMLMLAASEFIIKLSESYMLPVLSITSAFAVTGSIFPNTSLDSFVNLLKKTVTWGITITMSLFTGFVSLKCTIAGRTDGMASKTVKMLVSGFIPIVGGAVSDAYSAVKGSFGVIKGTIGTAGIIAVVLVLLPKIIELFIYRIVMWIGSAVADVFSDSSVSKLLKGIDSGLVIAQSLLVSYGVMFILCSAILMQTL